MWASEEKLPLYLMPTYLGPANRPWVAESDSCDCIVEWGAGAFEMRITDSCAGILMGGPDGHECLLRSLGISRHLYAVSCHIVATDIKDVRYVINYDMPGCCEDYVQLPPTPFTRPKAPNPLSPTNPRCISTRNAPSATQSASTAGTHSQRACL